MDNRAIGIFDSGLGGLTAAKELERLLPREDIFYFGDSGRMPYGGKQRQELGHIALGNAAFLESLGVKAILVACGTISSNALDLLQAGCPVPCFGVIEPVCRTAAALPGKKAGVIATESCIRSGVFEKCLKALRPELTVCSRACPPFAAMVEQGHFRKGDALAEQTVREQLAPLKGVGLDLLLLGCTHYPLLSEIIADELGTEIRQLSCGAEAAKALAEHLKKTDCLSSRTSPGRRLWYTSGDTALFSQGASDFLGREIAAQHHTIE